MKNLTLLLSSKLKNCLSLGNGPALDRKRTGIESGRLLSILTLFLMLFSFGVGSAWGADYTKSESWNFSTTGNTNWSSVNCGSYCGGWGKNKDASPSVYKTDISNFSAVDFSKHENVSLTIYVKAGTNSGTNSYTVKLIDSDGNQVSTYAITKTNGMGSGSNSSSASESSVTFSPTQAFSGYRIDFYPKSFITQTRYVLTYDNKAASCTSITPSLSYASVGGTTLTVGSSSSGSPTVSGNTGSGAVTYSVTAASPAGCATVNNSTGVVTAVAAGTATITASVAAASTYCSGSATANFTISNPSYTVNWQANGTDWTGSSHGSPTTNVESGSKVTTLPTAPTAAACDGSKVFVGWTATPIVGTTNTAPTDLFTTIAGSPSITGTTTFYAVFASGGTSATRVTTTGGFASGDRIVIGNDKNSYIMLNTFATETSLPTETSSSISVSNANQQWLVTGDNTDGYLLTSGTVVAGSTGSSSGSSLSNTTTRSLWTFTTTSVNTNCLAATNKSSGYRLEYSGGWVHYNSTNAGWTSLKIYKVNYSAYATSCCTKLGSINGAII